MSFEKFVTYVRTYIRSDSYSEVPLVARSKNLITDVRLSKILNVSVKANYGGPTVELTEELIYRGTNFRSAQKLSTTIFSVLFKKNLLW